MLKASWTFTMSLVGTQPSASNALRLCALHLAILSSCHQARPVPCADCGPCCIAQSKNLRYIMQSVCALVCVCIDRIKRRTR
ncbi:hypothetical protein DFH11DRAFT_1605483 [Phellopilus nigrolimitatus]|nr:hypothetical protein DFH11DRAFT_1605483 [Phellopilus nigrolimitatus]